MASLLITYTVNCGVPMSPMNGSLGIYLHTREGATVAYYCDHGFRPSAILISICNSTARWTPNPEQYNCTFVEGKMFFLVVFIILVMFSVALVELDQLERNVSRLDIECPGDTISYICSVMSNSEMVQLTWRVTLPGGLTANITYDDTSILYAVDDIGINNIVTTLTSYTSDEYIESTIVFTVLADVDLNVTMLECISEDLDSDSDTIFVNIAGTE